VQTRIDDIKNNDPVIVTLHIMTSPPKKKCGNLFAREVTFNSTDLIRELHEKFLKEDPLFHFFLEPDLIIRISKNEVLEKIKDHLDKVNIDFDVYAYPVPAQKVNQHRYGENDDGPVMQRLYDVYLPLFHLNAIAALTMKEDEQLVFMERANHTFCNMAGNSRQEEADKLSYLASRKSEKKKIPQNRSQINFNKRENRL
jgi:hypothetical protein